MKLFLRQPLEPGGIIRLAVPDLKRRIESYMRSGDADAFMRSLGMRGYNARELRDKKFMKIVSLAPEVI